jgi:hypothetical protein
MDQQAPARPASKPQYAPSSSKDTHAMLCSRVEHPVMQVNPANSMAPLTSLTFYSQRMHLHLCLLLFIRLYL